jgi:hypothetical protein
VSKPCTALLHEAPGSSAGADATSRAPRCRPSSSLNNTERPLHRDSRRQYPGRGYEFQPTFPDHQATRTPADSPRIALASRPGFPVPALGLRKLECAASLALAAIGPIGPCMQKRHPPNRGAWQSQCHYMQQGRCCQVTVVWEGTLRRVGTGGTRRRHCEWMGALARGRRKRRVATACRSTGCAGESGLLPAGPGRHARHQAHHARAERDNQHQEPHSVRLAACQVMP